MIHLSRDLRRLLARYDASRPGELAVVARFVELLATVPDPFDREEARGHVTASALIVNAARDRTLLIHHRKLGRWLQPGGHVEPATDASILDAALREAREETGLSSLRSAGDEAFDLDVHIIPARGAMPAHPHHDVRFLFVADEAEAASSSEVEAIRWFPFAEAMAADTDGTIVQMLVKVGARE